MATPTRPMSFRATTPIREALERAVERETRSLAHQILHYVREGLARDGYLFEDPTRPRRAAQ